MLFKRLTIFLVFLIGIQAIYCGSEKQSSDSPIKIEKDFPDQEGWNSSVTSTKNGQVDAVVEYGHMARYIQKSRIFFDQGVKVDFYDSAGRKRTQLTAAAGELVETTNDIIATGHVKVLSDTGITVLTEKLAFNQRLEKIYSDLDVKIITNEGDTLYGTGFESDTHLHVWQIRKPRGSTHSGMDLSDERFRKDKSTPKKGIVTDSTAKKL